MNCEVTELTSRKESEGKERKELHLAPRKSMRANAELRGVSFNTAEGGWASSSSQRLEDSMKFFLSPILTSGSNISHSVEKSAEFWTNFYVL